MKNKIPSSIQVSLLFYLVLLGIQSTLFFYAPSFYIASIKQSEIPAFIKLSFLKLYGLIWLMYFIWALLIGLINGGLIRKWQQKISHPRRFFLLLTTSQFFLLFFAISYRYPTILGFFPKFADLPLLYSYSLFAILTLLCFALALRQSQPIHWQRLGILVLAVLWPLGLNISLLKSSELDLPEAKATTHGDFKDVLLLSFDALDGDSANKTLENVAQSSAGRIFTNAFTPLPSTHPAWNSILSGLYPEHHGVRFFFESPLKPLYPELYLQNQLKQKGNYYKLFASDMPETSYFTAEMGFEEVVIPKIGWEAHLHSSLLNHFILPAIWLNNAWAEKLLQRSINSPALFNYDLARFFNFSFEKLSTLSDQPKFMALHSCHLHTPIHLNQSELSNVTDYLKLSPKEFTYWKWSKPGDPLAQTPSDWVNPYFVRRPNTLSFLQGLFGELQKKGYLQSDLVVFLSDHGERFANGHEIYGGIHGFDLKTREQNNVALAFFDTRLKDLKILNSSVSLIDITPTVLSLLGIDIKGNPYDGIALLDNQGHTSTLPKRAIMTESMGFIEETKGASEFPRISVKALESSLSYQPNGRVHVDSSYYQLIMKNKEYSDLSKQGSLLGKAVQP